MPTVGSTAIADYAHQLRVLRQNSQDGGNEHLNTNALPFLDALNRQFHELASVCLLRYLHSSPYKSDVIFKSPLANEISGKA